GFRLALAVRGRDYESPGAPIVVPGVGYPFSGVGPFLHDDPRDRPKEVFGGTNTLHFEPGRQPYLLLPVIPRYNGGNPCLLRSTPSMNSAAHLVEEMLKQL